jgi:hypothetical protein
MGIYNLLIVFVSILGFLSVSPCSAVDLADPPAKDNSHVGLNPGTPDGREGGETVADAILIPAVPYSDTGNTSDNIDDYDEVCPYSGSLSPDVVYAYSPAEDQNLIIDLCTSAYDTKIYIYENFVTPGEPYACNDDEDCELSYRSRLEYIPVFTGNTYYIVIDGYGSDSGDYEMFFDTIGPPPPPCELECPPDGVAEGEPPLVAEYDDVYNDGCQGPPDPFQFLDAPILCAVSGWYPVGGGSHRDQDWFSCFADENGYITASAVAEYDLYLFLTLPTDCSSVGVIYSAVCQCEEVGTIEFAHPAYTEAWLWCGPTEFEGPLPVFEFDYVLTVDGIEFTPPSAVELDSWGGIKSHFK